MKSNSLSRLPLAVRDELTAKLVAKGFSDYTCLTDWLTAQGFEISRSTIGRYGKKLKDKLDRIRTATEAAKMIAQQAEDNQDARSASVMALLQADFFDVIMALNDAKDANPEDRVKLLAQASRAMADLSRASIGQKKYAETVRQQEQARVKGELAGMKRDPNLDAATLNFVTEALYGIGNP